MVTDIQTLARRLADNAEAVCAHYLSNGTKQGRYWLVGDVNNTPGRSLYVRLVGPSSGRGAAGKWNDAATGDHGDLVDLIRINRNLADYAPLRDEILSFLSEPVHLSRRHIAPVARNSPAAARRLFAASQPVAGTLGERYLRSRGYDGPMHLPSLRFHGACYYRDSEQTDLLSLPAIIAAVTDQAGTLTAVSRMYLDVRGTDKAPVASPRKALGDVLGNAVRIGRVGDVLIAGEGVETMLALRSLLPHMPVAAALSAGHLSALELPSTLSRLYIAVDDDHAGLAAAERLIARHLDTDIDMHLLKPQREDWNADLLLIGAAETLARLQEQLHPLDRPEPSPGGATIARAGEVRGLPRE